MNRTQYKKTWAQRNREYLNAYQRAYYKKNRTKKREQARARWRNDKDRLLARSRAQYARRMNKRPKKCECCKQVVEGRRLHWDHNHQTGQFRGWLCGRCNPGIGLLGDNLRGVLRAVKYLESRT